MNCDKNSIGISAVFFTFNFIKLGIPYVPKLAIISRDYLSYEKAFNEFKQSGKIDDVDLVWANKHADGMPMANIEYALANPNIMSRYIDNCRNILWLQSTWAGVTPLIEQSKRDYKLTGLKNVFGAQMREYVMAYVLYFQRKVPELMRNQEQQQWQQHSILTLQNQTMGIMGLGNIGHDVAVAAKAFGMRILSLNASSKPNVADEHFHIEGILTFANQADVIVNLLPHTQQTTGLCNKDFFDAMRPNAIFINAGRGNIISNDNELLRALNNKKLRAAVIDVFKVEPPPPKHPFWNNPALMVTNHTAASSQPELIFSVFKENLLNIQHNRPLTGLINMQLGY